MKTVRKIALAAWMLAGAALGQGAAPAIAGQNHSSSSSDVGELSWAALTGSESSRRAAMEKLLARGSLDIVPTLALLMRISGNYKPIAAAMSELTGVPIVTWRDAWLYQQAHPQIVPHKSYRALKMRWLTSIDKKFARFFDPKFTHRDKLKIRFEEIIWGGALVDGIPPLDNPRHVAAGDATYLHDDDLVFGVAINGDVRAYPLRIMGWHEMFNEVIGGVPVALAYCTLCGSGILFETKLADRAEPLVFGSSGLLYRSNKLMFDRQTNSLWNQFTGEPVGGPLVDSGIKLKMRPVEITSWAKWRKRHPDTQVLSVDTGHIRDYGRGVVYKEYFSSPDLMFPALVADESVLKRKEYVFGIRQAGAARAWPVKAFADKKLLNDAIGDTNIVLLGDAHTRSVRAYKRKTLRFTQHADGLLQASDGSIWTAHDDALVSRSGERLSRMAGHIAYWFAWDGYLGVKSTLYPN